MRKEPVRKQLGILVDTSLWAQLKILAIKQGRTGGELLEQAIKDYIEKHRETLKP